eukprot:jgi/Psemu1/6021/gm1.6021_g
MVKVLDEAAKATQEVSPAAATTVRAIQRLEDNIDGEWERFVMVDTPYYFCCRALFCNTLCVCSLLSALSALSGFRVRIDARDDNCHT